MAFCCVSCNLFVQNKQGEAEHRLRLRHPCLAAAVAAQLEGVAICAFRHGGVLLMCADPDHVQRTQVAASVVVLALLYGTLNVRILFHFVHPSFFILFASEQS